jgi:hypothetical protein
MPPRYRLRGQASPAGPSASVVLPQAPVTDLDPTGTVTGACNDVAGALPDVPSPKEISELPKKSATDVLNNIKDDIVSTMAAARGGQGRVLAVGQDARCDHRLDHPRRDLQVVRRPVRPNGRPAPLFAIPFLVLAAIQAIATTDWGILARAASVESPLAFIFTAMAVGVTALLLAVTDGMSDWITHTSHANTEAVSSRS